MAEIDRDDAAVIAGGPGPRARGIRARIARTRSPGIYIVLLPGGKVVEEIL